MFKFFFCALLLSTSVMQSSISLDSDDDAFRNPMISLQLDPQFRSQSNSPTQELETNSPIVNPVTQPGSPITPIFQSLPVRRLTNQQHLNYGTVIDMPPLNEPGPSLCDCLYGEDKCCNRIICSSCCIMAIGFITGISIIIGHTS